MWLHSSVGRASHRYRGGHGFESRWSPDFFQASFFQLLKLENLLRWSHFTFIYNCSTNMNYFIYISQKQELWKSITISCTSFYKEIRANSVSETQKNVSDFVQKHFVSATNVSQFVQPKKHHEQQCICNTVSLFASTLIQISANQFFTVQFIG